MSGYLYSEDGGKTFVDGGQLPSPGDEVIGTTRFPQVFGDPEVKYLGNCVFVYSSILVEKFSDTADVQTMGVHRSTDCGKTWAGSLRGDLGDQSERHRRRRRARRMPPTRSSWTSIRTRAACIMSWSNFTPAPTAPGGVEIRTTYSDNLKTGGAADLVAERGGRSDRVRRPGVDSAFRARQQSTPTWRGDASRSPARSSGFGNSVAFARSLDNGATWQAPIETAEFFTMDQVLGNDRVNTSPSLAVDNSRGPRRGTVYLVYANNNSGDGADIVFQKSTDGGETLSAPIEINAAPGEDRPQWFPWVSVDTLTGRVQRVLLRPGHRHLRRPHAR